VIVSLCSWLATLIVESASSLFGDSPDPHAPGTQAAYGWFA